MPGRPLRQGKAHRQKGNEKGKRNKPDEPWHNNLSGTEIYCLIPASLLHGILAGRIAWSHPSSSAQEENLYRFIFEIGIKTPTFDDEPFREAPISGNAQHMLQVMISIISSAIANVL